jgi:hypothetical protein
MAGDAGTLDSVSGMSVIQRTQLWMYCRVLANRPSSTVLVLLSNLQLAGLYKEFRVYYNRKLSPTETRST